MRERSASGTPVLAYGRGGACESVLPGKTGYWFKEQTVDSLADCIERFERDGVAYSKEEMRAHSRSFSEERFERELRDVTLCANLNLPPEEYEIGESAGTKTFTTARRAA